MHRRPRRSLALLAVLAFLAASVLIGGYLQSRAKLKFDLQSPVATQLQVFHSTDGLFREADSHSETAAAGTKRMRLRIPAGYSEHLRIDPAPGGPVLRLCKLGARDGRLVLYDIAGTNQLAAHIDAGCLVLEPHAGAEDPFVVLIAQGVVAEDHVRGWRVAMALSALLLAAALLVGLQLAESIERLSLASRRLFETASRHAHWLAFGSMLLLGGQILHALPPNGVPDEPAHLSKIAKMHGGVLLGDSGHEPVVDVAAMYGELWGGVPRPEALDRSVLERQLEQPLACDRAPRALPRSADQYAPHLYVAPTLAMAASCGMGASFGGFLDTARIFNLLLGAFLVAFGIRQAGHGKWALFIVAMLPMTISQVASISADSMLLSLTLCFIGYVSGVASGKVGWSQARIVLPLLAVGLAFAKPGAAWILAAVLFCYPAFRDNRRRFAALAATSMLLPWLIHVGWTLWSAGNAHYGPGVDPEQNRALLLEQPGVVARMAFNTFLGDGLPHLYNSMIGRLGWLDIPLSPWAYVAGGWMLFASVWTNPDDMRLPMWVRVLALMAAGGSLLLLALPLLLTWTQPGAPVIQGLQGRYFLPTLAFVLVFCALRATPVARLVLLACVLCAPMLSLDALSSIHLRYHGS
ncbi:MULTISPECIES: DUF2142 domain-containing protein [unclassified Luteimonas]|uniref:DUF2142 domain-containing protein n=1 Tax=unclassified Luteimonas TaxID=2629088 RepID=UPI0018F0B2E9|nr:MULTISPECIES: DUF2142 domain-containing protein [unclassified Luteimonas]MBJ6978557.1 DUF2142 domain-containing protein [Luteimonas sp. MC1895]MBJ6983454.1 DUF2142 domain-containing protein [Luteimonas sp. MC1750]QQO06306.1 DUF2142 domain-containing protein [Luteimonas sp. MC1750]